MIWKMRQLHKLITYKKANPTLTQSLPRHDALSNAVCVQHLYLPRPLTPVLHFPVVLVLVLAPEGAKAAIRSSNWMFLCKLMRNAPATDKWKSRKCWRRHDFAAVHFCLLSTSRSIFDSTKHKNCQSHWTKPQHAKPNIYIYPKTNIYIIYSKYLY